MNKILKGLLVAMLAVSAAQVKIDAATARDCGDNSCNTSCNTSNSCNTGCNDNNSCNTSCNTGCDTDCNTNNNGCGDNSCQASNKTFMMTRSHGVNLSTEYTTFNELVNRKNAEDRFGANFQVAGYYQASHECNKKLAGYFLNGCNTLTFGAGTAADNDVQEGYLVIGNDYKGPATALELRPKQTSWAVLFDYRQDLDKVAKGLYLYANLPVAQARNSLRLNVLSGTGTPVVNTTVDSQENDALYQYLVGNDSAITTAPTTAGGLAQAALTHSKLDRCGREATGVADINLALGYKVLDDENYYIGLALAVVIPTGTEVRSAHLWDAVIGNGKHFGLGFDWDSQATLWSDEDQSLKLNVVGRYRYLFESHENRVPGFSGVDANGNAYDVASAYRLTVPVSALGTAAGTTVTLQPFANIAAQRVRVTPGNEFDGIFGFAYNCGGFTADLGYNLYYRDRENVCGTDCWSENDGKYAMVRQLTNDATAVLVRGALATATAATSFTVGIDGITDGGAAAGTTAIINKGNLDFRAAATPAQLTHSLYGGVGYSFIEWDNPLMLGAFGKYEWSPCNSALEQWSVGAKVGIGF